MVAYPEIPPMAKSNTPKVAKSPEKPKVKKTKTAVSLTDEAIRRLGAACTHHRLDQSDIIEWLIKQSLSGYVIQVRGEELAIGPPAGPVAPKDRQDSSGDVSQAEAVAAQAA
jgi:hypothetical protein